MTADMPWEVVIAGAGPTGLTLANHLGALGVRTLVLEMLPELIDYPRGVGMDDESLRSFQAVGLAEPVRRHTVPNQAMRFVDRRGRLLVSINPLAQPFGWPRRSGFIQPLVDRELARGLARFPNVSLSFNRKVRGYVDDGGQVRISVQPTDAQGGDEGPPQELRARFLVGCDGGRSPVRAMMQLGFEGKSESTRWLVIDLANDPIGKPNVTLVLRDDFPYVEIALPHGVRRYEFLVPSDEEEGAYESLEAIHRLLHRVLPAHVRPDVIRHRVYTHHARIAPTFGKGNVFLAGDAAHLMPVWQGQGFNTGIRDATNLAWKLALAARHGTGTRLLESYTLERHAHAAAMIDLSVLVGKIFVPANSGLRILRNIAAPWISRIPPLRDYVAQMRFKPMPFFEQGAVVHGKGLRRDGPVGRMFGQPWVMNPGGDAARFDDVVGLRFALVSWSVNVDAWIDAASRRVLDALQAVPIVVRPACQDLTRDLPAGGQVVADRDGDFRRWFDAAPGSVMVLRPDRIVAAVCMPFELDATLRALAEALGLRAGDASARAPVASTAVPIPEPGT
ncbi:bifunctional 3-(3-hydroxy-phenyl)propionate/3-hydroxycinnamic acid hydroxylase [Variovorax sp. J22P168]|uniref:bifunctional 3-(3-hydroxy-phenyl)propionate/3-hydroxycinnamic acid hydroxylase MhpA n=1 Tax=Variovorax jilinensis TaxID=3053513 RepID=UPI00257498DB|nr:bifunctional 3-(3-hydroxy-phenyl)propionate/3-hydroxycinnamic acid hydroxylase [Variovorax sp. J22P168]MDM0014879.1 bifunctional 3-(3-hydroxy-phenyl)propionate/3-hydroxycinnamic acid hydroxylase [Variovorax sp. J22P168]